MKEQSTVLLVEDDVITATTYKMLLRNESILLTHLKTGNAALTYLNKMIPDVMLLDLGLPDISGMDILKFVCERKLKCVVIVLTTENAVDVVVEAMHCGAFNFIEKPCQATQLITTLRDALHQHHLSQQVEFYEEPFIHQQYHNFVGISKLMQTIYHVINNVASQ